MRSRWLVLGALFLSLVPAGVHAQSLRVGSPAPALSVGGFLKGQPVRSFEKGKIYVMEFWATWCGPCRESIPHLSALQKKYPQVTMIGVSVWENSPNDVKPFIKEMGSKMEYRVAVDQVPPGKDGHQGKMARAWMTAAAQDGVPAAFIINGNGQIAWIGHPMEMDGPLAQVVAGKWNLKAAAEADRSKQRKAKAMKALAAEFEAAGNDLKRMLQAVNKAIQKDPQMEETVGIGKLKLLRDLGNAPGFSTYGRRLVSTVYKNDPEGLVTVARVLVDPSAKKPPTREEATVALSAAQRADSLTRSQNPVMADTLARAYFVNGNVKRAIELQQRAVQQSRGTKLEQERGLTARLEQYRKAAR